MENKELINRAAKLIRRHHTGDGRLHGDVGAVVVSSNGQIHEGVCVDTASWGLCAERSAIAAMITWGEYQIRKVVAVWQNDKRANSMYFHHVVSTANLCGRST